MVAINAKVIYRFEVRVLEESFFNAWVRRDFVILNRRLLFTPKKKIFGKSLVKRVKLKTVMMDSAVKDEQHIF